MSLQLPSRQLMRVARTAAPSPSPAPLLTSQRRTFITNWLTRRRERQQQRQPDNPLTEEYLTRKPAAAERPRQGDISASSIFADEEAAGPSAAAPDAATAGAPSRNPEYMAAALDPDPASRRRWQRKMVIRAVRTDGRLSKAEQIKRSERELTAPSELMKTSVKKLMPLARQIAGKTVEEAIVQMRFSKKMVAKNVKEHLEHARNQAIVQNGMGLGAVSGEQAGFAALDIRNKKGVKVHVADPTTLYVDQAWVTKGVKAGMTPEYRARGRVNMLVHPTTRITVVLKEEKTRIRQHNEREEKIKKRKTWVQLPNRPITAQRQYYSW